MPNIPVTKDDVKDLISPLRDDIQEIVALLREQNGRLRVAETEIAVLKDRSPNRAAAAWGGGAAAIFAFIEYLMKR